MTVWYLLAQDTIEEEIHALVEAKRAVVNRAIEGDEKFLKDERLAIHKELIE